MGAGLVDITCALHRETERAILVSDTGDEKKAVWLPKSKIEFVPIPAGKFCQPEIGGPKLAVVEVTLPEWMAIDKGLL